MITLAAWARPRWPVLALIASALMLAGAHAFERFGNMAPCALCLEQRNVYWGAILLALACIAARRLRPQTATPPLVNVLLGFVFLAGCAVASFHVAVEHHWVIAQCDAARMSEITTLGGSGPIELPRCDRPAWSMFGVTMAGYNALISLGLAAASFFLAWSKQDA